MNTILERVKNTLEQDIPVKEVTHVIVTEKPFFGTMCRFYCDPKKVTDQTFVDVLGIGVENQLEFELQRSNHDPAKGDPYMMLAIHNLLIEKIED